MKPCKPVSAAIALVAPLAGAWIETARITTRKCGNRVAPLAGAWIETVSMP